MLKHYKRKYKRDLLFLTEDGISVQPQVQLGGKPALACMPLRLCLDLKSFQTTIEKILLVLASHFTLSLTRKDTPNMPRCFSCCCC